jgi:hypothetical protein
MRNALTFRLLAGLMCAGAFAIAGCGITSAPSSGPLNPEDSSVQQSNQAGSPTLGADGTSKGQVTSGEVTLSLDKQHYTASDAITVTITNGLATSIWVTDHQTNCTVVTVERQQDGHWQAVAPCLLMIATRMISLAPASLTPVRLLHAGTGLQNVWPAGTYRVKLSYRGAEETPGAVGATVYSEEFSIG